MSDVKKLWDYYHPYYMSEGCYYSADCLAYFKSFADFLAAWPNDEIDYNRVHRWDFNEEKTEISIYYVMQRKAYTYSCHIEITETDLPYIKMFLKPHAELNRKLWEGVLDE